jgi:hypothetical protein
LRGDFAAYGHGPQDDTLDWVREKLRLGQHEDLVAVAEQIAAEIAPSLKTEPWPGSFEDLVREFEAYLETHDAPAVEGPSAETLAIRIYGFLLKKSPADIHEEAARLFSRNGPRSRRQAPRDC